MGVVPSFCLGLRPYTGVGVASSRGIRDEFRPFVWGASFIGRCDRRSCHRLSLSCLPLCSLSPFGPSLHCAAAPILGFASGVAISMVVCAPFVRWDIIRHGSDGSARAGAYYLETAEGERVICAVAVPCEGNRITYKPFDSFLEDYRTLLPSASTLEWNFRFQLAAWLDGIVYYSFLRYSEEGIGSCWHFSSVSPDDVAQRLPLGLRRHFLLSGPPAWILVLHGYRIWPIEIVNGRFGDGWDKFRAVHQLKADFKVIFACERKWIFHTVILDKNDREVRFHWSGQNMHHRQLHPSRALRTSCLPSLISNGETVLKFG